LQVISTTMTADRKNPLLVIPVSVDPSARIKT